MRLLWYFSVCAIFAVALCGQAAVEHATVTAGASAAAAGGASGAGKSVGGILRSLSETLDKAGAAASGNTATIVTTATPAPAPKPPSKPPATASKPIDLSQVTEGLDRAELVKRIGEPAMRISEKTGSQLVERLWYNPGTEDQVAIRLIDGKVASVIPLAGKKQEQEPHSRSDVAVTR